MLKKAMNLMLVVTILCSLAACGQAPAERSGKPASPAPVAGSETPEPQSPALPENEKAASDHGEAQQTADGKTLIVYFSWSGSTEKMAASMAQQTGGDLYEIEPETPYPTDYNACGDVARAERDNDERPAIANLPDAIDQYDTILVGYPIWWHTAPMVIGTFLERYDLTGKEIYPFTQSASMDAEQFEHSVTFLRENANGAAVHDGLFERPSDTDAINSYLLDNGLVQ